MRERATRRRDLVMCLDMGAKACPEADAESRAAILVNECATDSTIKGGSEETRSRCSR